MDNRKQSEQDYHNKAFSEQTRKGSWKFYSVANLSNSYFEKQIARYSKNKTVLDYGCGLGENTEFLSPLANEVKSIDISDYAISLLKEEKPFENVEYMVMDAEETFFPDNYFDLVCGQAILHHLDLEKSLNEISRILKDNGVGVFVEPLGHNPFVNLYRKLTPDHRTHDEHPLLQNDIRSISSKFKNVQVKYFHVFTLLTVPFRNLKIFDILLRTTNMLDGAVFNLLPFTKKYAWVCVLTFSGPIAWEM